MSDRPDPRNMERLRLAIGFGVLGTWLGAFVVSIFDHTFDVAPSLQLLMTLIAGTTFAPVILGRHDKGDSE